MSNTIYRYKKLNLNDLEPNKQYTFYKKDNTNLKATLISILNDTLIVTNYETYKVKNPKGVWSMPKEWISYVELEDFTPLEIIKMPKYLYIFINFF